MITKLSRWLPYWKSPWLDVFHLLYELGSYAGLPALNTAEKLETFWNILVEIVLETTLGVHIV